MGKKLNNSSKGKKEVKEIQPVTRKLTINLHKQLHGEKFKKKAPKAVKVVKTLAQKMMFTKDVRVDPELNKELWRNGVRNVTRRISVIMERKKNEEDDEAEEKIMAEKMARYDTFLAAYHNDSEYVNLAEYHFEQYNFKGLGELIWGGSVQDNGAKIKKPYSSSQSSNFVFGA